MLPRRRALTSLAASGVALATERVAPAVAAPRRVIVDSQIHLWPANTPERPWLAGAKPQLPERGSDDERGGRRPRRHRSADARRRAARLCAGGGKTLSRSLRRHGAYSD